VKTASDKARGLIAGFESATRACVPLSHLDYPTRAEQEELETASTELFAYLAELEADRARLEWMLAREKDARWVAWLDKHNGVLLVTRDAVDKAMQVEAAGAAARS
jgi:hypothetical protein